MVHHIWDLQFVRTRLIIYSRSIYIISSYKNYCWTESSLRSSSAYSMCHLLYCLRFSSDCHLKIYCLIDQSRELWITHYCHAISHIPSLDHWNRRSRRHSLNLQYSDYYSTPQQSEPVSHSFPPAFHSSYPLTFQPSFPAGFQPSFVPPPIIDSEAYIKNVTNYENFKRWVTNCIEYTND